jgi:serine/threonine protein kinase
MKTKLKKAAQRLHLSTSEMRDQFSVEDIKAMLSLARLVGVGCFGRVYATSWHMTPVAVKMLGKPSEIELMYHGERLRSATRREFAPIPIRDFLVEVNALMQRPHEHLVRCFGYCSTDDCLAIVLELMSMGELRVLIQDTKKEISLYKRVKMARDAARGISWLHSAFEPAIIHRDIATKNLFVTQGADGEYVVKIGDLGLSARLKKDEYVKGQVPIGTPLTMAPEIMRGAPYNTSADVYSFAMVLWEILHRKEPFEQVDTAEQVRDLVLGRDTGKPYRHSINPTLPRQLRQLVTSCWAEDPSARPDMDTVIYQLNKALIKIAISDPHGQKFWRKSYGDKENIPWYIEGNDRTFAPVFYSYFKFDFPKLSSSTSNESSHYLDSALLTSTDSGSSIKGKGKEVQKEEEEEEKEEKEKENEEFHCLEALLAASRNSLVHEQQILYVNIQRFGELLQWFGPIILPSPGPSFLDRVRAILCQSWFHGHVDQKTAEGLVERQGPGSFLVRFSSAPGCWTVTYAEKERVLNVRINRNPNTLKYCLGDQDTFDSLPACIDYLVSIGKLQTPCSGSHYQAIFRQKRDK